MKPLSKGDRVIFVKDYGGGNFFSCFAKKGDKGVIINGPHGWDGTYQVSVNGKESKYDIRRDFIEKI